MPKKDFPAFREATGYDYDYLGNSASATDCTGLIPSAPQSKAELESYEDVYHYQPPVMKSTHHRKKADS